MANAISRFWNAVSTGPKRVNSFRESGVSGTPVYRGYISPSEKNADLLGSNRYRTAADILTNVSIVASGIRYFLNLVSDPAWRVEAVDDTPAAIEAKDFVEDVIFNMETSWSRIVRRSGMYRYHGFGISEWTAERRDDGRIGIKDIEPRPQHTIERWGTDETGAVTGVWQRSPQDGTEIWLPRSKIVYLVDDMMTDSPEGLGWFRALVGPAQRTNRLLELETIGFERNFAGTPVGRAPIGELQKLEKDGEIPVGAADTAIAAMDRFVEMQAKKPTTGITLDSAPYLATTQDGMTPSAALKWGIDLLKGEMTGVEQLQVGIDRGFHEMARIIGVESMLVGSEGVGSLALSKDKSNNLYIVVNSTLRDMAEAYDRDVIDAIWWLNGFPDELRPKLKTEDVAFKDVEQIAATLRDMAAAGATLSADDPAINDLRALAGISQVPQEIMDRAVELEMRPPSPNIGPDGKPLPAPKQPSDKAPRERSPKAK